MTTDALDVATRDGRCMEVVSRNLAPPGMSFEPDVAEGLMSVARELYSRARDLGRPQQQARRLYRRLSVRAIVPRGTRPG